MGGFTIHNLRLLYIGGVGPQPKTVLLIILIQSAITVQPGFTVLFVVV